MRVIKDNRRIAKPHLQKIAAVGWACLLYLAWVVGWDSWERTTFSLQAIAGALPELDPFNQRYVDNPRLTLFHTVPGLLFVVLGPLQFMGPVRRRVPVVHRISGRIFLVIGITSGVAAFLMTLRFPIWGWTPNVFMSAGMSVFMVFAFVQAFRLVKQRNFARHREWMIRGFAAGMSVAFFRVMLDDVLPRVGVESFDTRWNIVVATSFPIVLGVAELWIRATRPKSEEREPAAEGVPAPA